ncbi:hypothetical protein ACI5KX_09985 [Erythrobacter sp. GH1-10]|uniref:hypothetical protein n=1 Tax=Erythrobacter sp. GH1-10 TaxID=3349334 RepID=UPI0038781C2E
MMSKLSRLALITALSLAVFACGENGPQSICDEAMPDIDDVQAMEVIEGRLEGDDKVVWERIKLHTVLSQRPEVASETVGEALERERAKRTCRAEASSFEATIACSKSPI